mmetsp:Transcript_3048/g.4104  ORF Transcript_3048/g.4104 Transcript_3048/m.4104 type:complete len:224 (+) Transcript_3048:79-750(+)
MRLLSLLLLAVMCEGFLPRLPHETSHSVRSKQLQVLNFLEISLPGTTSENRDDRVLELVNKARKLGPVGVLRPEEEQQKLFEEARAIAKYSDRKPARFPLKGFHELIYSAAPGGSSGKIGPFSGKVRQEFVDDTIFINTVELGPLKIALRAERKVLDDKRIRVTFRETTIYLFGNVVTSKELENSGGVWNYIFSGEITDTNGNRKLVRVMETPSLFIIEQDLD